MESKVPFDFGWSIIEKYMNSVSNPIHQHLIDSYHDFLTTQIPGIIENKNPITFEKSIKGGKKIRYDITIHPDIQYSPTFSSFIGKDNEFHYEHITPRLCRERNGNLFLLISVKLNIQIKKFNARGNLIDSVEHEKKDEYYKLGHIPLMVNSGPFEGGYFIMNGKDKIMTCQEAMQPNRYHIFIAKKDPICQIRSHDALKIHNYLIDVVRKNTIYNVRITQLKKEMPLPFPILIWFLLPEISDRDIIKAICDKNDEIHLYPTFEKARECVSSFPGSNRYEKAVSYISTGIATKVSTNIDHFISTHLFPHISIIEYVSYSEKAIYLIQMVRELLSYHLGKRNLDDRDDCWNKRIRTPGSYLTQLFYMAYDKIIADLSNIISSKIQGENYYLDVGNNLIQNDHIETVYKNSISTGKFQLRTNNIGEPSTGLSETLMPINVYDRIALTRRVYTPIANKLKMINPRRLNSSQYGFYCPLETPEGEKIGLTKNLALTCRITNSSSSQSILTFVEEMMECFPIRISDYNHCILFLNDVPIKMFEWEQMEKIYQSLLCAKRNLIFSPTVSVSRNLQFGYIYIYSDAGRLYRPLIVVENWEKYDLQQIVSMNWIEILERGIVEYVDMHMMAGDDILIQEKGTHMELHPIAFLGICAGSISHSDHNQSPRNAYESAMIKQSIGIIYSDHRTRWETVSHHLVYPENPIVSTKIRRFLNPLPNGQNCHLAIMTYTGYNMEDSVIINQDSIRRGLFNDIETRTFTCEIKRGKFGNNGEQHRNPIFSNEMCLNLKKSIDGRDLYAKLGTGYIIQPGTFVEKGDVLVGKTSKKKVVRADGMTSYVDHDTSLQYDGVFPGIVEDVIETVNGSRYPLIKVKVSILRTVMIGDKMSSPHAQKGVVSLILPGDEMPYTEDGIVPDIIMNCHSIPSRMTIGQTLEQITTKLAVKTGQYIDTSPFETVREIDGLYLSKPIVDLMKEVNFDPVRETEKRVRCGLTGQFLKTPIFLTPLYYQRLKHMTADKFNPRSTGKRNQFTRQPTEGKQNGGGPRSGHMELVAYRTHGVVHYLAEKMGSCSDEVEIYICRRCNKQAIVNLFDNPLENHNMGIEEDEMPIYRCQCRENFNRIDPMNIDPTEFVRVKIPYITLQFMKKIKLCGIDTRMFTET